MAKYLIVNADDFGFTRDVNEGIVDAHRQGILTATTVMANGAALHHALSLAGEVPDLDLGGHLVLVQGRSVADPTQDLPSTLPQLLAALSLRRIDPYAEFRAQVELLLGRGLRLTHLDTHKHTHLLPPVLEAVARVAEEFSIPWVRIPFDYPSHPGDRVAPVAKRVLSRLVGWLARPSSTVLSRHGCRTTDYFSGFQLTGRFRARELELLMRSLPEGVTEFMCHPGYHRDELESAPTRLKRSRELELTALCDPSVRKAIHECGVRLITYSAISC